MSLSIPLIICALAIILIVLPLILASRAVPARMPLWVSGGEIILIQIRGATAPDLPEPSDPFPGVVILNLQKVRDLSPASIEILLRYSRKLQASGKQLLIVGIDDALYARFQRKRSGIWRTGPWVMSSTEEAWDFALRWIHARRATARSPRGSDNRAGDRRGTWRRGA